MDHRRLRRAVRARKAHPGIDLIMPDIRYLAEQREKCLGIVATHAHEDHIGAIAPLWPQLECPIYATPFTARLIEGKLAEAGLDGRRCGQRSAGGRHAQARAVRHRFHFHHPFDPGAQRCWPSARLWAWSPIPATGSSIPIRCWAR